MVCFNYESKLYPKFIANIFFYLETRSHSAQNDSIHFYLGAVALLERQFGSTLRANSAHRMNSDLMQGPNEQDRRDILLFSLTNQSQTEIATWRNVQPCECIEMRKVFSYIANNEDDFGASINQMSTDLESRYIISKKS